MLPDGSHVEIGGDSRPGTGMGFILDESIGSPQSLLRPHYLHSGASVQAPRTNISGTPGKENLKPTFPLWAQDDFTGGQELKIISDPSTQGTRYDSGLCNARYPGQLSGVPTRTDSNIVPTANKPPILCNALGLIWLCEGLQTWSSTDGSTWTLRTNGLNSGGANTSVQITQATGGNDGLYVVSETTPGVASNQEYRRVTTSTNTKFVNSGSFASVYGWTYLNGLIYRWTLSDLNSYDTTAVFPVTGVGPIYSTGPGPVATNNYGGACVSENSVILMTADDSTTRIHEYKAGAGSLIWNMPQGFSGRAVTVSLGVVFVAGVYIGGFAALFGMSLQDRIPQFISYIGQTTGTAYVPTSMAAGPGDQVLVAMASGEIFVYSEAADAVTELDARTTFTKLNSVSTYKTKRIAAWEDDTGSKSQMSYWGNDIDTTTTSGTVTGPAWDLGFPEEDKILCGYHVVFAPISAASSNTITLSYQSNEDGTWYTIQGPGAASGVTVDKNVLGASTGNVYVPISDAFEPSSGGIGTISFRKLRDRIVVNSGAIVYAVTARTYLPNYEETWEIVLRIKDDPENQGRTTRARRRASEYGDFMLGDGTQFTNPPYTLGVVPAKKFVYFKDGYGAGRKMKAGTFTTHLVSVELVGDIVYERGEGNMRVILHGVNP